jgi:hypothetical protein
MRELYPLAVTSAAKRSPDWSDILRISINDYLQRHDISLNLLAQQTDVRQSVLHRFMTGVQGNLRIDTAQKLAVLLGLELRRIGEFETKTSRAP